MNILGFSDILGFLNLYYFRLMPIAANVHRTLIWYHAIRSYSTEMFKLYKNFAECVADWQLATYTGPIFSRVVLVHCCPCADSCIKINAEVKLPFILLQHLFDFNAHARTALSRPEVAIVTPYHAWAVAAAVLQTTRVSHENNCQINTFIITTQSRYSRISVFNGRKKQINIININT